MASLARQAACAVLAVIGLARFQSALLQLKRQLERKRSNSPDSVFLEAWALILQRGPAFRGMSMMRNRFSYPWKDMAFLRLLEEMKQAGFAYRPEIRLLNAELLPRPALPQPVIVVTLHSPVDAILNRVFEECGIDWALLAAGGSAAPKAALLGLRSPLDVVIRSGDALLLLRRKLREGKLVCANIDDAQRRPGSLYCDVFISPAIFQLAIGAKARVVYAFARVGDDGRIEVSFGNPAVDAAACDARDYAQDFIAWLRNAQGDRRNWQVREWAPARKDRLRKLVLTEAICTGESS